MNLHEQFPEVNLNSNPETDQKDGLENQESKIWEGRIEEIKVAFMELNKVLEERESYGFTEFLDYDGIKKISEILNNPKENYSVEHFVNDLHQIDILLENSVRPSFNGIREGGDSLENLQSAISKIQNQVEEFSVTMRTEENEYEGSIKNKLTNIQETFGHIKGKISSLENF